MRKVYRLVREYTPGKMVEKVEIEEVDDEIVIERGGSTLRLPKSRKEPFLREGMSVGELLRTFESFPSLGEIFKGFEDSLLLPRKRE